MTTPLPDLEGLSQRELIDLLKSFPKREPSKPGAEDVDAMEERNARLQILYYLAGRNRPDHSLHGLMTGLDAEAPF